MRTLLSIPLLTLLAGAALLVPTESQAKDREYRRDLDGDGHYNTKKVDYHKGHHHGYSGHRGYSGRGYYGSSYYNRGYGYGYGSSYSPYRYGYPRYGYGYGPTVVYSSSSYSRPSYSYDYSDDLAADVQRSLKRRGYYHGSIDGDIGPASRAAIRRYQANHGLSATGRIDRSLLRSLGIG